MGLRDWPRSIGSFFSGTPRAASQSPWDDYWYSGVGAASLTGLRVNADTAMRVSAVFACVRVLSETLASVPLIMYRRRTDDGKERATNHPLYDVLHNRPNSWQTSFEWRETMMTHASLWGDGFSRILPGPRGPVDQLVPIHPDRVTIVRLTNGSLAYDVKTTGTQTERLLQDEMFHLRGPSWDGVRGVSLVNVATEAIGLAQAAQQYSSRFYGQDATPAGVLEIEGELSEEGQKRLRASWEATYGGLSNTRKVAILEQGLKYKPIAISPRESMTDEQQKFVRSLIASYFRVPLHLINDLERATFSNIEHLSLEFVMYTMLPWFTRWEQAITRDLIVAPQTYFAEFLVDGLLRGDQESRYKAYAIGRNWGWLSVNDIRRFENMNPIEKGDIYLQPLNMRTAGSEGLAPSQAPQQARLALMAGEVAGRLLNKEKSAIQRAAKKHADDPDGWREWAVEFYDAHAADVAETLHVTPGSAKAYAAERLDELLTHGVGVVEQWESERLTQLGIGEAA